MSQQTEQILKITPTLDQWNRFKIWHCHTYVIGSGHRMEEFARQLVNFEKEYSETGSITLTDIYMIENWNNLIIENFVLGILLPEPTFDQIFTQMRARSNLG